MSAGSMHSAHQSHQSVMVDEVLHYLAPQAGEIIVDGTAGRARHTRALLAAADCQVSCVDRDQQAIAD